MKKKPSNKAQDEKLIKIHQERDLVKKAIEEQFSSAEGIGVDTEFKEVSLMVSDSEFLNKKRSFSTDTIDFKLEDSDGMMLSIKFKYIVK